MGQLTYNSSVLFHHQKLMFKSTPPLLWSLNGAFNDTSLLIEKIVSKKLSSSHLYKIEFANHNSGTMDRKLISCINYMSFNKKKLTVWKLSKNRQQNAGIMFYYLNINYLTAKAMFSIFQKKYPHLDPFRHKAHYLFQRQHMTSFMCNIHAFNLYMPMFQSFHLDNVSCVGHDLLPVTPSLGLS